MDEKEASEAPGLLEQLKFDFTGKNWPEQDSFPLNLPRPENRKVEERLIKDIEDSNEFLIITGFTSLSYLIELYDKLPYLPDKQIKIALGFEPNVYHRKRWSVKEFSEEINAYWLEKGISPLLSGGVINLLNQIEANTIQFRLSEKMHAKLYVGDEFALLGSSNLSRNGLSKQKEANIRVAKEGVEAIQYESIKLIAENFYDEAFDYKRIKELLTALLKPVEWPEALSRAIAELIEGNWIKKYPEAFRYLDDIDLWPSQRMAIGQAIHILDNQGSVLVADPTGSGKTKLLACLELALVSRRWQLGKGDQTYSKIICPPIVKDNWIREFEKIHFTQSAPISSGVLSFSNSSKYDRIINELKKTNILIIDEAHNYLNPKSSRSISLKSSLANCSILATATPINKKAEDLLRLVELLDIDNLGDDEIDGYKKLRKQKGLVTSEQTRTLRKYIRKFTVRRTKKQLNKLIDNAPDEYLNREGKKCRYPVHVSKTYNTGETKNDIVLALKIDELTHQLKGLINLRKILLPHDQVQDQQRELEKRLIIAKALARYQVQSKLRSSRAALIEHLLGSEVAFEEFGLPHNPNKKDTGNIIGTLKLLTRLGKLPKTDFDKSLLPDYLKDQNLYEKELEKEIEIYGQIISLTRQISGIREQSKLNTISKLFGKHPLILAFDSSLITLYYLQHLASQQNLPFTAHVVTGGNAQTKAKVIRIFELGSKEMNHVALCSDAMSEGVNLQQASAVVLLDMPSVLRIAEQRIGRLDRMDSPHKKINAYWPKDTPAFGLKADKRLIKISFMADYLIGSNLELPEELIDQVNEESIDVREYINEFENYLQKDENWDGINDAFEAVRNLVYGDKPLIPIETYDYYKNIESTVNCKVSILESPSDFGFFSFKGTASKAPNWIFIDHEKNVSIDLSDISRLLAGVLPNTNAASWNNDAKTLMKDYLKIIEHQEISLLPNKKRRALKLLQDLLLYYQKKKPNNPERTQIIKKLNEQLRPNILNDQIIDYNLWLDQFIIMIQPDLNALRDRSRYNNPKDIRDLLAYYKKNPLTTDQLLQLLMEIPYTSKPSERVAACIIGVGCAADTHFALGR